MKTITLILLAGLSPLLSACSNSSGGVNKGLVGAATGGILGSVVGDHLLKSNNNGSSSSSTTTGGTTTTSSSNGGGSGLGNHAGLISGAVAGYAAGAISDSMSQNEVRQKYLDGYNKGRSDAIKDLYWLKRDAERASTGGDGVQRRYYEVPVPEHVTTDGVLVEPRKVIIEVVE